MSHIREGDMFELADEIQQNAVIKVIGVGGGGGNAVQHMVERQIDGVDFICANTDAQALRNVGARSVIQLGNGLTKGLGAGANPNVGREAALEDRERIAEAQLTRSTMPLALLFVTPASTSSLESVFMASGKMPVVVGVAVIILAGLGLWWVRTARTLQRLSEEENTLKGTHNA